MSLLTLDLFQRPLLLLLTLDLSNRSVLHLEDVDRALGVLRIKLGRINE